MVQEEPPFFDYHQQVQFAINNVQELNRNKSSLMQGTFDIQKSRVQKSEDLRNSDDVRSSNDSGCSVDASSEKTQSKHVPKFRCNESHSMKEKVKSDSKKKCSPQRPNKTQSRTTPGTINCNQNENYGPKNVTVVGKTVRQLQKSKAGTSYGTINNKAADDSNNTHVTVVQAPKVDTAVSKLSPSTDENKNSARSTYETIRTAPSDKKVSETKEKVKPESAVKESRIEIPVSDTQTVPSVNNKVIANNQEHQKCSPDGSGESKVPVTYMQTVPKVNTRTHGDNQGHQRNENSKCNSTPKNNTQKSSQKTVPPPRPVAPPRQYSNLAKSKTCPKPVKRENSTMGSKSIQNNVVAGNKSNVSKQQPNPGNFKPAVPPRPQSVLSGNEKQEILQTQTKNGCELCWWPVHKKHNA